MARRERVERRARLAALPERGREVRVHRDGLLRVLRAHRLHALLVQLHRLLHERRELRLRRKVRDLRELPEAPHRVLRLPIGADHEVVLPEAERAVLLEGRHPAQHAVILERRVAPLDRLDHAGAASRGPARGSPRGSVARTRAPCGSDRRLSCHAWPELISELIRSSPGRRGRSSGPSSPMTTRPWSSAICRPRRSARSRACCSASPAGRRKRSPRLLRVDEALDAAVDVEAARASLRRPGRDAEVEGGLLISAERVPPTVGPSGTCPDCRDFHAVPSSPWMDSFATSVTPPCRRSRGAFRGPRLDRTSR